MVRRREVIAGLGAAVAWPLGARAQQPGMPVIGYLSDTSREEDAAGLAVFRQGLTEAGYVEGRNGAIEYRGAEGQNDRLPALAADLVRRRVGVIVANGGTPAALAAKAATTTIPIVFHIGADAVALGLVASLSRPSGNLTGVTSLNVELGPKRLELLHEMVPTATIIGLLVNPTSLDAETLSRDMQAAARILGVQLHVLHASTERDFDTVFATLVQLRASGLVIGVPGFLQSQIEQLAALAIRHAVPTIASARGFAAAGGLMGYGGNSADQYRTMGTYTGRILKGEKPSDLPVQEMTKVELVINLKTARAFGLTFPLTLLGRADEVIE